MSQGHGGCERTTREWGSASKGMVSASDGAVSPSEWVVTGPDGVMSDSEYREVLKRGGSGSSQETWKRE